MTEEKSSKDRILEAAVAMAGEKLGAGLSVRAVAARAGVSTGSLRHHFPTQRALQDAVLGAIYLDAGLGPARALVPLFAGILGLARLPFQLANVASALVWAFVLLAPGAGLLTWLDR